MGNVESEVGTGFSVSSNNLTQAVAASASVLETLFVEMRNIHFFAAQFELVLVEYFAVRLGPFLLVAVQTASVYTPCKWDEKKTQI